MENKDKKKWRFEIITPASNGQWRVLDEFDDDLLSLYQEVIRIDIPKPGIWEFRIVLNDEKSEELE